MISLKHLCILSFTIESTVVTEPKFIPDSLLEEALKFLKDFNAFSEKTIRNVLTRCYSTELNLKNINFSNSFFEDFPQFPAVQKCSHLSIGLKCSNYIKHKTFEHLISECGHKIFGLTIKDDHLYRKSIELMQEKLKNIRVLKVLSDVSYITIPFLNRLENLEQLQLSGILKEEILKSIRLPKLKYLKTGIYESITASTYVEVFNNNPSLQEYKCSLDERTDDTIGKILKTNNKNLSFLDINSSFFPKYNDVENEDDNNNVSQEEIVSLFDKWKERADPKIDELIDKCNINSISITSPYNQREKHEFELQINHFFKKYMDKLSKEAEKDVLLQLDNVDHCQLRSLELYDLPNSFMSQITGLSSLVKLDITLKKLKNEEGPILYQIFKNNLNLEILSVNYSTYGYERKNLIDISPILNALHLHPSLKSLTLKSKIYTFGGDVLMELKNLESLTLPHVLVPLTDDELKNMSKNKNLKNYNNTSTTIFTRKIDIILPELVKINNVPISILSEIVKNQSKTLVKQLSVRLSHSSGSELELLLELLNRRMPYAKHVKFNDSNVRPLDEEDVLPLSAKQRLNDFLTSNKYVKVKGVQCFSHPELTNDESLDKYGKLTTYANQIEEIFINSEIREDNAWVCDLDYVNAFLNFPSFNNLTTFNLWGSTDVPNTWIESMIGKMPVLEIVNFTNNHSIVDLNIESQTVVEVTFIHWHKLERIKLNCPSLSQLFFDSCSRVSDYAPIFLCEQELPQLNRLYCIASTDCMVIGTDIEERFDADEQNQMEFVEYTSLPSQIFSFVANRCVHITSIDCDGHDNLVSLSLYSCVSLEKLKLSNMKELNSLRSTYSNKLKELVLTNIPRLITVEISGMKHDMQLIAVDSKIAQVLITVAFIDENEFESTIKQIHDMILDPPSQPEDWKSNIKRIQKIEILD
eukprot:TRINITY_DN6998_c0_g1_i1.p1 TRINITY_DN6998_c0_g1~~TRINITY_DN6998_c0_g1_i1.p1  ORF type:complete len:925 (-),score=141.50 TRINITY_DN6998_c0_g1_i1:84-2858(-)